MVTYFTPSLWKDINELTRLASTLDRSAIGTVFTWFSPLFWVLKTWRMALGSGSTSTAGCNPFIADTEMKKSCCMKTCFAISKQ